MPPMRNSFMSFLIGILCVVMGILCVLLLNTRVTLDCIRSPRATDQCTITTTGLRSRTQQIPLRNITRASVEKTTNWARLRSRRTSYRVVLETKSGPIPLTEGYSSRQAKPLWMADQITMFVRSRTKPSLRIVENDGWLGIAVGAVFGVAGLKLISRSIRQFDG